VIDTIICSPGVIVSTQWPGDKEKVHPKHHLAVAP
jgi:hypothetical protein